MYWIKRVFILLIVPFVTFSCASTKETKTLRKFSYEEPTLSKGIERRGPQGIPIDPTDIFTTEDPKVVASLKDE